MKYIALSLGVMLLILALSIFNTGYIEKNTGQIIDTLSDSLDLLEQTKYTGTAARFYAAKSNWNDLYNYLSIIVHHDELDGIITAFDRANTQLNNKYYSEYDLEVSQLICLLQSIIDSEKVNIENIL